MTSSMPPTNTRELLKQIQSGTFKFSAKPTKNAKSDLDTAIKVYKQTLGRDSEIFDEFSHRSRMTSNRYVGSKKTVSKEEKSSNKVG